MPEKQKKIVKKSNVRLVGAKNTGLVLTLDRSDPVKLITYATHITIVDGKKKRSRGATEKHTNEAAAVAAVKKLHASAVKLGWSVRVKGSKPDTFDATHLPKA